MAAVGLGPVPKCPAAWTIVETGLSLLGIGQPAMGQRIPLEHTQPPRARKRIKGAVRVCGSKRQPWSLQLV